MSLISQLTQLVNQYPQLVNQYPQLVNQPVQFVGQPPQQSPTFQQFVSQMIPLPAPVKDNITNCSQITVINYNSKWYVALTGPVYMDALKLQSGASDSTAKWFYNQKIATYYAHHLDKNFNTKFGVHIYLL
jgi:hypothetical protein